MKEASRTLAFVCPKCRQPVIVERSVFSLCAARTAIPCPCGGSRLEIDPLEESFNLTVPCSFCRKAHRVTVPRKPFLYEKTVGLSCGATGLDCCYVGEEGAVYAAVMRLEEAMDQLPPQGSGGTEEAEAPGTFLNELVMREELEELKSIASAGGVSCSCGSTSWSLRIHYASLELVCGNCGGKLRIPAASQEDLTDLCCKNRLLIRER